RIGSRSIFVSKSGRGIRAPPKVSLRLDRRRAPEFGEDRLTVLAGAVLDRCKDLLVHALVDSGVVRWSVLHVDATMRKEVLEAEQGIIAEVVGRANSLVREPTHRVEFFLIHVIQRRDRLKGELDERGAFLCGLVPNRLALDDAKVSADGKGLGAFGG